MDDLDRRLIALLRSDARMAIANLAAELGVTRATARARLDRLIESGAIQGFTVVLGQEMPEAIRAICMIEVEGRSAERVIRRLRGFPEVRNLWSTNGRWDVVAELEVADLAAFDAVLRQLRDVDGITVTETSLLLAPRKGG